jgi:hypothetical protein
MKASPICLICGTFNLFVPCAFAAIDQQYVPATTNQFANVGVGNVVDWAQTFTVGITGTLTGFDVWVDRQPEVSQPLLFDIRTTLAGAPSDPDTGPNVLASGSLPASMFLADEGSPGSPPSILLHVELSSRSFSVVAGQVLAIALRSDDPGAVTSLTYNWHGNEPGAYTRGSAYLRVAGGWEPQVTDQVFRAYVNPIPEPSAALLLIFAVASAGVMRRRVASNFRR